MLRVYQDLLGSQGQWDCVAQKVIGEKHLASLGLWGLKVNEGTPGVKVPKASRDQKVNPDTQEALGYLGQKVGQVTLVKKDHQVSKELVVPKEMQVFQAVQGNEALQGFLGFQA